MARIRIAYEDYGALPEELIMDALYRHEGDPDGSTFFVSRRIRDRIFTRLADRRMPMERTINGWRMPMMTPYGVVYIEADASFASTDASSADAIIEVEWSTGVTYEECICTAEAWMAKAEDVAAKHGKTGAVS
jgi:hypothetical protein